jgi:hypothetical protein
MLGRAARMIEVRGLKARGQVVQLGEAGGHAGQQGLVALALHEGVDVGIDALAHGRKGFFVLVAGHLENGRFRKIDDLLHVAAVLEAAFGDGAGLCNQVSEDRLGVDDAGIVLGVDGQRDGIHQGRQKGGTADLLQPTLFLETVGQSDQVHRFATRKQVGDGGEDFLMGGAVKILRPQDFDDVQQAAVVDQNGAQQRLLGFQVLRRDIQKRWVFGGLHGLGVFTGSISRQRPAARWGRGRPLP